MKTTILFSIPHGQHARDLLRSHLLPILLKESSLEIVILTPAVDKYRQEFSALSPNIHVEELRVLDNDRRAGKLKRIRDTPAIASSSTLLNIWGQIERRIYPLSADRYAAIFKKYQPSLVVTPTPGQKFSDIPVLWAAKKHRVPSLAIVASWDNLVTKGTFGVRPDYLAVWNSMMFEEAVKIHHFPKDRIFITGAPQFDLYVPNAEPEFNRDEFLSSYHLDPKRKTIFITTAPARATIDHVFILDLILKAQESGEFDLPTQVLCRLHPEDEWDRFKSYEGKAHFAFDFPSPPHPTLYWDPPWSEQRHLVHLFKASDVNINVASTITLEACLSDVPVVNISFSPHEKENFEHRIVQNHYGKHYKHVLERQGVQLARNEQELAKVINAYLHNPGLDRQGRQRIAQDFTHGLVGTSGKTIASLILSLTQSSPTQKVLAHL